MRRGETYDQFVARQKAEATGNPVPSESPTLTGDPVNHMHVEDAIKLILNPPPVKKPSKRI